MLRKLLWRPEAALFFLVFVAYAYFYQAGGWNQNVRFDLVRSLVEQQTTVIDDYRQNTGDLSCWGDNGTCKGRTARPEQNEHYYCDKAPGVSLLGTLPYALIYATTKPQKPSPTYLEASAYLSTLVAVALPSALGVVALYILLGLLGASSPFRVALSLGYAFATLAFPYSTLLYGHQPAAALLLGGFTLLVRARRVPESRPSLFAAGALLGYAVVCEYPAALGVVPITIYAAYYVRPWRRLFAYVAGGTLAAILLGAYHTIAFGGPLTLPYEFSTQHFRGLGYFMGLGAPNWEAFSNTMFTPYRGLFYSAPWLLLALPGAFLFFRRKQFAAEAAVCLAVFFLFMWMTASLIDSWHGGWSLGSRYMIPAIPFLVAATAGLCHLRIPSLWPRRILAAVGIGALGFSAFLMLAGTAVRPEVPQHIKKPFEQYLLPQFTAGNLAVNPQGIDMIAPPRGQAPPQAWNLGQLLGLDGLWSLVPLFAILALGSFWLVKSIRKGSP